MGQKQFFGLKYPFTTQSAENYLLDLNSSYADKIRSNLLHVLFTPKGQRIRNPNFGTNLIKYIFENNDEQNWSNIIQEVNETVSQFISGIIINDISVLQDNENMHEIFIRLDYTVTQGNLETKDNIIVKI